MTSTVVRNGTVFTGTEVIERADVYVHDGKVQQVGREQALDLPPDSAVIDATGMTVLPGLIDAHTHLTYHAGEYALLAQQMVESLEFNTLKAAQNARHVLETGCTTIGDGGSRGNIGVAMREAVRRGVTAGPRIVTAGQILCGSAGIQDHTTTLGYLDADAFLGRVVNGPQEVVRAVREQVRQGVDCVKVTASGNPGLPWIDGKTQDLSYDELAAAVVEARKFGKYMHAHAHDKAGIIDAARAGAVSLHSGEFVDEEGLQVLKQTGCIFVPTIAWLRFRGNTDYARKVNKLYDIPEQDMEAFTAECVEAYEACAEAIVAAHAAGVPMAIGSDAAHVFPPFDVVEEMAMWQDLGIPAVDVLRSATTIAAAAIDRADTMGRLEPGYLGDLLVVDGSPLDDVGVLRVKSAIRVMVQGGAVLKNTLVADTATTSRTEARCA
jgi:imidazolonepropionase-like amidohydrolase